MAFQRWQIGLHIQSNTIRIVAVMLRRGGWQLCHWWQIPWLERGLLEQSQMLTQALTDWRYQLPVRHDARMAFAAGRTVQRQLPYPASLREADCERYVARATAQQMQMTDEQLCVDYQPGSTAATLNVTAAHEQEVKMLRQCAKALKLRLTAVTPDASALSSFFPWLPAQVQMVCFYLDQHWLWATRQRWGVLSALADSGIDQLCQQFNLRDDQLVCCGEPPEDLPEKTLIFDPWQVITENYQELPLAADAFTVALGLAIGVYHQ